jgi:hypothetical protein
MGFLRQIVSNEIRSYDRIERMDRNSILDLFNIVSR